MKLLITSGRGPVECRMAAEEIATKLEREANSHGLDTDFVYGPQDRNGNSGSIVVTISGEAAMSFGSQWLGTVQWIAKSTVRVGHKRKNWFVSVSELPETSITPTAIKDEDVRYETFRAGGPGGQHQNKTDSAVRAIHAPSGRVVVIREGRSQHQNKKLALQRLADVLAIQAEMDRGRIQEEAWRAHDRIERGNPIKVFHG